MTNTKEHKICKVCGRTFFWQKRWEKDWDQVKYCSDKCRKRGLKPIDNVIETTLLDLVTKRGSTKSICPSEVARAIEPDESAWRKLLQPVRMAARRLAYKGKIRILRKGKEIEPTDAKGVIRLALK